MATTTNFGWETPDDTDLVKDGALAIRTLGSAIDTSLVDLKGGTTGQVLSKTSNTDMDFTWVTSDDANAIQNAIVDAKGDLIAASAADTPARLAVGNNGDTLLADSSTSTGLRYQSVSAVKPNFAVNGNFDFWQRGTSFTSSGYTADRWYASIVGTTTVAQESTIVPDGSTYALKWTTGASSSYAEIYNAFEAQDVNALGGKTITVSVKVRAQASFASTFRLRLQTNTTANTQTGGAWTTVVTTDETPSTSAFTTVSATYTVPVGTKGLRIALQPAAAQASGTGLYLGQAQLEVGSVATAYKYAGGTLQGELAACQRYFERFANDGGATGSALAIGFTDTTTTGLFPLPFTEKRVTPTFTFSAASGFQVNTAAATAISSGRPSKKFVRIDTTGSGYTANVPANLRFVDSSTATIDISAEL
jgi:hypothetical protein